MYTFYYYLCSCLTFGHKYIFIHIHKSLKLCPQIYGSILCGLLSDMKYSSAHKLICLTFYMYVMQSSTHIYNMLCKWKHQGQQFDGEMASPKKMFSNLLFILLKSSRFNTFLQTHPFYNSSFFGQKAFLCSFIVCRPVFVSLFAVYVLSEVGVDISLTICEGTHVNTILTVCVLLPIHIVWTILFLQCFTNTPVISFTWCRHNLSGSGQHFAVACKPFLTQLKWYTIKVFWKILT